MKYLQLYDHLGNLVKEFEVFVDGQDFSWAATMPVAVWLGTIRLVAEKAAGEVEPTPEPEPEVKEPEGVEVPEEVAKQIEEYEKLEEVSAEEEAEVQTQAPFTTPETITEEEAKKEGEYVPIEGAKHMREWKEKPSAPEGYEEVKIFCTECGLTGQRKEFPFGHDDFYCPECGTETVKEVSEVKREPEKRSDKSSRSKRTGSSTRSKRSKTVPPRA